MLDAEKCNAVLEERGLSKSEVARRTGISLSNVSVVMSGKRDLYASKLKKICEVLDCTAEELW